jgi:hypothetical protein
MKNKNDIETLLNLDGVVIEQVGGHWTKFEVREVPKTDEIPHGIRYSLTLHDRAGKRIMGFDNAHAVRGNNKGKYQGRKTFDHRHRHSEDTGVFYLFVDAHQLLKDFWAEVDKVLGSLGFE